jgi:hypothetical protein
VPSRAGAETPLIHINAGRVRRSLIEGGTVTSRVVISVIPVP